MEDVPIAFRLDHTTRDLKQTARTEPANYLIQYTSRTPNLVAIFAIKKVLERV
jgi:hypothetical protein